MTDGAALQQLLPQVVAVAREAGRCILEVYEGEFDVHTKGDGSPLTTADRESHDLIVRRLADIAPDIPILSEESAAMDYADRRAWPHFWLVDPLDGTKEFIKRNGEFTVNIALISGAKPVLGVVDTPVKSTVHFAAAGSGAFRAEGDEDAVQIHTRRYAGGSAVVVASRSHANPRLHGFVERLEREAGRCELRSLGSSLKLCLVAEGHADVYPRLGPTSEWDVAAAHCIIDSAGGAVFDAQGRPLGYNKRSLLNPWFIAVGDASYDWCRLLEGIAQN